MPKVSVLLPTFNRPEWLVESVRSVLAQDADFELIILDNGSGEATGTVLDQFKNPRIKRVRVETNGPTYDGLLPMASGDYIVLFSDDDRMLPGNLAQKANYLDKHHDCGLVYGPVQVIGGDGLPNGMVDTSHAVQFHELFRHNAINLPSVMFRRSLAPPEGALPAFNALSDWALWLEVLNVSRAGFIDGPLVQVRVHSGSDSSTTADTFADLHFAVWSHWLGRGHTPSIEDWAAMRLANLALADQRFARFKQSKEAA